MYYKALDTCSMLIYNFAMLTIKQTQDILKISYPTALQMAHEVGQQIDGRWFIPDRVVAEMISAQKKEVAAMEARLRTAVIAGVLD